jgi:hypothetical protein
LNDLPIILKVRAKMVSIISKKNIVLLQNGLKSLKNEYKKNNVCHDMKVDECFEKTFTLSILK